MYTQTYPEGNHQADGEWGNAPSLQTNPNVYPPPNTPPAHGGQYGSVPPPQRPPPQRPLPQQPPQQQHSQPQYRQEEEVTPFSSYSLEPSYQPPSAPLAQDSSASSSSPPQPLYPSITPASGQSNSSAHRTTPPELSCHLCQGLLKDPCSLPCCHTFCRTCVTPCILNHNVACPTCQVNSPVPPTGLPKNIDIALAIEAYHAANAPPSTQTNAKIPIPPDAFVAPCQVNAEEAKQNFRDWTKDLWLAPSNFIETVPCPSFAQYFVPFYCFTAEVENRFSAQALLPVGSTGIPAQGPSVQATPQKDEKQWKIVKANRRGRYPDVALMASNNDHIQPLLDDFPGADWDVTKAVMPVQRFPGLENIDPLSWTTVWAKYLDSKLRDTERKLASQQLEGEGLLIKDIKCQLTCTSLVKRMVLLPIWLGVYRFESKEFSIVVHGQTGKVQGERPYGIGQTAKVFQSFLDFGAEAIGNLRDKASQQGQQQQPPQQQQQPPQQQQQPPPQHQQLPPQHHPRQQPPPPQHQNQQNQQYN
eukprot:CAMPEP_0201478610 /NCGR_PEP_ID=MMETSP0151_2-20130828/3401_1 /ASSEMBLY_ACC=CAM_ASM_000257 /TAXON_ID=200890 /ORGANISM="Paramoeba atlantica, Strain 621/1 / CCAP 1560/9" /LENGTH=529 /DNA_ID=CAMNT_0047859731 /DNA_START=60 /DNA_END=1649 /DNA_ORIENTATION=+